MILKRTEKLALAAIERAAKAGRPAPSNDALAGLCGYRSSGAASNLVKEIERKGLIRIKRIARHWREITIVASGLKTAPVRRIERHKTARRMPALKQLAATAARLSGTRAERELGVRAVRTDFVGFGGPRLAFAACQWIKADAVACERSKCGVPTIEGKSYCAEHAARAYIPRPAKQKENEPWKSI